MMSKRLTPKEKRAIQGLKRIASKWPTTLCLVHHGDSFGLHVKRVDELGDDPAEATSRANISIKTESCA